MNKQIYIESLKKYILDFIQANRKLNYSNERIYKGLIDLEPNTEEILAAVEKQEYQKRKQASKFLVKKIIFIKK